MIPAEAVEAAWDKLHENPIRPIGIAYAELEAAIEAAAPHMQPDRKSLADVLAAHQQKVGIRDMRSHCWCGWSGEMTGRAFIEHQADAISAGGTK